MAKFKVGDKVRVNRILSFSDPRRPFVDHVFTIKSINPNGLFGRSLESGDHYGVYMEDGHACCFVFDEYQLELVGPATFTKANLKDGMIVDVRNGSRYIIINNGLRRNDTWLSINPYLDDLTRGNSKEYDVMKVYTTVGHTLDYMFDDRFLNLVWERKEEEPVKEMTVAEIEEKLGYKVKVIADEK